MAAQESLALLADLYQLTKAQALFNKVSLKRTSLDYAMNMLLAQKRY
jgi:hypothetical protein